MSEGAKTHTLRLRIDAGAARKGGRQFTAAVESMKRAILDLDRASDGTFTELRKGARPQFDEKPLTRARTETEKLGNASDRAAERIRTLAVQSSNTLRVSTDQASRLRDRLLSIGDTAGLARLEDGLERLRAGLTNATSGLDVREARAGYSDLASELNRTAREAERLRAETIASANAQETAANAATTHAAALERLAQRHDPLRAASKAYENSLSEIQQLEDAGILSAQRAAQARERASQTLAAASGQMRDYGDAMRVAGHQSTNAAFQIQDVFVTAEMGMNPFRIMTQQGLKL